MKKSLLAIATSLVLAACGGGGDSGSSVNDANLEGLYIAQVDSNSQISVTIDGRGRWWSSSSITGQSNQYSMYSTSLDVSGNNFTGNAFSTYSQNSLSFNGNIDSARTLRVKLSIPVQFATVTTSEFTIPLRSTSDNQLVISSKSYSGVVQLQQPFMSPMDSFTVTVTGTAVKGNQGPCSFTGSLQPTTKNYQYVTLTFANSSGCQYPGRTIDGIIRDWNTTSLKMMAKTSDNSAMYIAYINK